ncbi:feruloyl-CoA synthase [Amycolatopsis orientalis]|uniref:feruloyl-CoA synthase n=1 Tax=Amycolatopsis orientalis TaxID=31958 RepID=UPI0005621EAC|nr:feruloyl-CoA synthase [Amycolatopsis orientalis]
MKEVFAEPVITCEDRADGVRILRSTEPLGAYPRSLADPLRSWARKTPHQVLAAERTPSGDWFPVTYGEARTRVDALAQALLDRGLGRASPLLVLSGNTIDHLLLTLACYTIGAPIVPVSVAYSVRSDTHLRLRAITELVRPGMVFADDGELFGPALDAVTAVRGPACRELVARNARGPRHESLDDLLRTTVTTDVDQAFQSVTGDDVAKILFTSGSTDVPKGVLNTHAMLAANQQMLRQIWPFVTRTPPVLTDWLPWSHTFGGNHNLHLALRNGGSLYIDNGKPTPDLFDRTLEALRSAPPTVCVNVPAGYAMLVDRLEQDHELASQVFSAAELILYAGAALDSGLRNRLHRLAKKATGRDIPVVSSWGATETGPAATSTYGSVRDGIGVPLPGVSVKLVPHGARQEIRVLSPSVTAGYVGMKNDSMFDDEGYYRSGDAVRFVVDDDPRQGLMFDGRIAEDFKLSSGTWVAPGRLRETLLATTEILADAVVVGADRSSVSALCWLRPGRHKEDPDVRLHLARKLAELNRGAGSASRIERLLLVTEPPSLDHGEITDKGYINQRAVVTRRAALIASLYQEPLDPSVVRPASELPAST